MKAEYVSLMQTEGLDAIKKWPMGKPFALRDIISNPQALWGMLFYKDVLMGVVPGVEPLYRKDASKASLYQKRTSIHEG